MEPNETELIAKSQKGDTSAFDLLVRKHEVKIYNLLLRMTGNEADANDLFQEVFLSAWRNLQKFKGNSNFSTWLYRIAVNAVLMKHRKRKLSTVSLDEPLKDLSEVAQKEVIADWSENPLATLENNELKERLSRAITKLPEKYRTILILSDIEGLPNEEIGKIMNLSLANVKSRLHRARLFLREELSDYFARGNL